MLEEKLNAINSDSAVLTLPTDTQDNEINHSAPADNVQETDKLLQLYKQGFSEKQIAKVLQMDLGEVELVLNMFKKKQSYQK